MSANVPLFDASPMRRLRAMLILAAALLVSACQTDLYTDLSEREANQMLAALLPEQIDAHKVALGDGLFTISVPEEQVRGALAILDSRGLPRGSRESIGVMFAKSGIVSSPFEERIRYVYALSEEVGRTIQEIDGVLVARVHIVMPEEPELGQEVQPSSAAVFIKQQQGFDLDFLMPQVRRLVANAIEGVNYDDVTVVLVEAQPPVVAFVPDSAELVEVLPGLRLEEEMARWAYVALAGVGGAMVLLFAVIAVLGVKLSRSRRGDDADEALG